MSYDGERPHRTPRRARLDILTEHWQRTRLIFRSCEAGQHAACQRIIPAGVYMPEERCACPCHAAPQPPPAERCYACGDLYAADALYERETRDGARALYCAECAPPQPLHEMPRDLVDKG